MRKITLAISIATASLMVSACNKPAEVPKDESTTVDATEAMAPVVDANATNVVDGNGDEAKMAVSGGANSAVVDDDKGGDPGGRK